VSKTRLIRVAVLAVTGLALTGCGADPGVAVKVGDERITDARVAAMTASSCAALSEELEAREVTLPMSYLRQDAAKTLAMRSVAEQVAQEHGVEAGPDYYQAVSAQELQLAALDEDVRADFVELSTTSAFVQSIGSQVGVEAFEQWLADHDVEFDPEFGVDSELNSVDESLSVAVSDVAVAGADSAQIDALETPEDFEAYTEAYTDQLSSALTCG
jgi:hypothetical protein